MALFECPRGALPETHSVGAPVNGDAVFSGHDPMPPFFAGAALPGLSWKVEINVLFHTLVYMSDYLLKDEFLDGKSLEQRGFVSMFISVTLLPAGKPGAVSARTSSM